MAKKKSTRVSVKFPTFPQAALKLGVDAKGRVQNYTTNEIMRNLPDFMPKGSGKLIASMTRPSSTSIRVSTSYARFLFFGKTKAGQPVDYQTDKNPKAGGHWDKRMVAERGKAITAKIQRFARKQR